MRNSSLSALNFFLHKTKIKCKIKCSSFVFMSIVSRWQWKCFSPVNNSTTRQMLVKSSRITHHRNVTLAPHLINFHWTCGRSGEWVRQDPVNEIIRPPSSELVTSQIILINHSESNSIQIIVKRKERPDRINKIRLVCSVLTMPTMSAEWFQLEMQINDDLAFIFFFLFCLPCNSKRLIECICGASPNSHSNRDESHNPYQRVRARNVQYIGSPKLTSYWRRKKKNKKYKHKRRMYLRLSQLMGPRCRHSVMWNSFMLSFASRILHSYECTLQSATTCVSLLHK